MSKNRARKLYPGRKCRNHSFELTYIGKLKTGKPDYFNIFSMKMDWIKQVSILLITTGSWLIPYAQSVSRLHEKAIVVDTHNDCLTELTLDGKDISGHLFTGQ